MRNLVIDYGNTAAKVGIFQHRELLEERVFFQPDELSAFVQTIPAEACMISSVSAGTEALVQALSHISNCLTLHHTLPLPIVNRYATPETLGVDRLAGVCGARALFPTRNCLVIDAGTCLTYDFIDSSGVYHGGAIAPGLQMRLRAMNQFTARLPLTTIEEAVPLIGDSTNSCLQSGAFNGMWAEIDGIIQRYAGQAPQLQVILCGGDTHLFENRLKGAIFAVQNLVLKGLNSILLHNVSH